MKADQASSIVWLTVGTGVIYLSYHLGLGTLTHPGPGFLAFWSGVLLCFLSGLVFIKGGMEGARGVRRIGQIWTGIKWSKAVLVLLALVLYGLLKRFAEPVQSPVNEGVFVQQIEEVAA